MYITQVKTVVLNSELQKTCPNPSRKVLKLQFCTLQGFPTLQKQRFCLILKKSQICLKKRNRNLSFLDETEQYANPALTAVLPNPFVFRIFWRIGTVLDPRFFDYNVINVTVQAKM